MTAVAWLALAPGLAALAAEATGQDERRLALIRLGAFGLLHPLPAYPVLMWSLRCRRPLLAAAALAVGARRLALLAAAGQVHDGRRPMVDGLPLTAVTVNLARDLADHDGLAHRLLELEPDLLLLQELTPSNLGRLEAAGVPDHFAHRAEDPDPGYFGSAVYSHRPIVDATTTELGRRRALVTTVDVGGRPITVVPVHTQAPVKRRDLVPWRTGFTDLAAVADAAPGPVVLGGDWNATWASRPFRLMLRDHGLVDAHAGVGRAGVRTWPTHLGPAPPLLGLDHVVVSADVDVLAVDEHVAPGTDHRIVRARLSLPTGG